MSQVVRGSNGTLFITPPNKTKILVPTQVPISEAYQSKVERVFPDAFSWRDVIGIEEATLADYNADVCKNRNTTNQRQVVFNRGNGKFFRHIYRPLQGDSTASKRYVAVEPDLYTQQNIPRTGSILRPVLNQQQCGSCWSFGTSEMLSNRVYISTFGKENVVLSPWFLVNNCFQFPPDADPADIPQNPNQACEGGIIDSTLRLIQSSTGITTYQVDPYPTSIAQCSAAQQCTSANGQPVAFGCPTSLQNAVKYNGYRAHWDSTNKFSQAMAQTNFDARNQPGNVVPTNSQNTAFWTMNLPESEIQDNIEKIKAHLVAEGPATVALAILQDFSPFFQQYPGGVYGPMGGQSTILGGHCVLLVGYGNHLLPNGQKVPYYELQNSWNSTWNDGGFFRIVSGINYCNIESLAMGMLVNSTPTSPQPEFPFPQPPMPSCNGTSANITSAMNPTIDRVEIIPISHPEPDLQFTVIGPADMTTMNTMNTTNNNTTSRFGWIDIVFIVIIVLIVIILFIVLISVLLSKKMSSSNIDEPLFERD